MAISTRSRTAFALLLAGAVAMIIAPPAKAIDCELAKTGTEAYYGPCTGNPLDCCR